MKVISLIFCSLFLFKQIQVNSQFLVSATLLNTTDPSTLSSFTGLDLTFDVDMYKIIYNTTGVDGQPTIASGAFCTPTNTTCTEFPIGVYEHGTSLKKGDVPSREVQEAYIGKIFAAGGYFVVMPDYLGMGDSPGLHPYCHAETEATATLDMIKAVREFIANDLQMIDNGELFLTGYSQGGHAAMATHKYIEDNNLLNEFNVLASAPCSGPYEISGAMADTIMATTYSKPGYIVYILASYQLVYGNIFNSYSEILHSPYDSIVVPFFNGSNTSLGMTNLNNQLPGIIDSLILDSVLQNFVNSASTLSHPLWQAMTDNDNHNWLPLRPVRMYYCTGDEQVTYQNAIAAETAMLANGAQNVEAINMGPGMHNECVFPSLIDVYNWFDTYRTSCSNVGVENEIEMENVRVYPTPFFDRLNFDFKGLSEHSCSLFDSFGNLVLIIENVSKSCSVDLSNISPGIYFLAIKSKNSRQIKRLVKQK